VPFGRMAGDFRLASIQCRTLSAASKVVTAVSVAMRGLH
jgi:hypothetical protein